MGIRRASRAEIPVWSLADLGLEASAPFVTWPQIFNPPKREIQTELINGESAQEVAARLAEKILAEKVL
jgi:electron transfer flavoprotein alpha/beta subunit